MAHTLMRRSAQLMRPGRILSDCAAPEDHQRAAQAGFDRHFDKPPDIERLQKILDELQVG